MEKITKKGLERIKEHCTQQDAVQCKDCIIKLYCREYRKYLYFLNNPECWTESDMDDILKFIEEN